MEGKGFLRRITEDFRRLENERIRRTLNKVGVSKQKGMVTPSIQCSLLELGENGFEQSARHETDMQGSEEEHDRRTEEEKER
jgi:hypothetical protein